MMKCSRCEVGEEERKLAQCPICKKSFCFNCAHALHGKNFCGKSCAEYFFFGEGDDEPLESET